MVKITMEGSRYGTEKNIKSGVAFKTPETRRDFIKSMREAFLALYKHELERFYGRDNQFIEGEYKMFELDLEREEK